jgi:hypothetical protein
MRTTTSFLLILLAITAISFKPAGKKLKLAAGTYGVCSCNEPGSTSKLELTINDDHTFRYFNNTVPGKNIDMHGTWEMKGNTVVLSDTITAYSEKWTIDKNEKCLKSRQGLMFTRLCHLQLCQ